MVQPLGTRSGRQMVPLWVLYWVRQSAPVLGEQLALYLDAHWAAVKALHSGRQSGEPSASAKGQRLGNMKAPRLAPCWGQQRVRYWASR